MFLRDAKTEQPLYLKIYGTLRNSLDAFLVDRKSQGLSPKTIRAYSQELRYFSDWLDEQGVIGWEELTADVIRRYLLNLSQRRNPGGCHIAYRVIKTFTFWWEQETDDEYRSPIRKVKPPRLNVEPLEGILIEDFKRLLNSLPKDGFYGDRNRAILLMLLDTGCREQEFADLNLADLRFDTGQITVRKGKGGKYRFVYMGTKARRGVRKYLTHRTDDNPALWVTEEGERLTVHGLRDVVRRASLKADIPEPGLHDFRRAFAINMLRAGVDIYTLKELMGHSSLTVLVRYLKIVSGDLGEAHRKGSPVDNNL